MSTMEPPVPDRPARLTITVDRPDGGTGTSQVAANLAAHATHRLRRDDRQG